jgi:hypothetical protein
VRLVAPEMLTLTEKDADSYDAVLQADGVLAVEKLMLC